MNFYAIYDKAAERYFTPELHMNDVTAIRSFKHRINNQESYINFQSADYDFRKIGTFDDHTGEITVCNPHTIINGKEALIKETNK